MKDTSFPHKKHSFNNQDLLLELPKTILAILEANSKTIQFQAGESIFKEGEAPTGIYRAKKGKVKKFITTNFGT